LPYSPALVDAFEEALSLNGTGRLLDVGCGPGTIALRIAGLFAEVVGVDADGDMIAEARRLSIERGVVNAIWVHMRAEALPADLGVFRMVTFAASFHWMDRPIVARTAREMLDPAGVVVHVDNRHQDSLARSSLPAVPRAEIDDLRRRYLGPGRRAGAAIRTPRLMMKPRSSEMLVSRVRKSLSFLTAGTWRGQSMTLWPRCFRCHRRHHISSVTRRTSSRRTSARS
jgi:SAM-dependent methyltransferase